MIKVIKDRVYFEEEILKLFPVLAKAENRKLVTCIALAVYYGGPWDRFPENERWANAKKQVYGKSDFDLQKDKSFDECKALILSFQFDQNRETIRNYWQKIHSLNEQLLSENNPKKIFEIDGAIEKLTNRAIKAQQEQDMQDEAVALKGGGKLSFLERWQDNMRNNAKNQKRIKEAQGVENLTEQLP